MSTSKQTKTLPPILHPPRIRTFCCCIPVRAGVIILSFLSMVGAGIVTVTSVQKMFYIHTATTSTWAMAGLSALLWGFFCFISVYGLCGAVFKRRSWVEWYNELQWVHLWAEVVLGIFALIVVSLPDTRLAEIDYCTTVYSSEMPNGEASQACYEAYRYFLLFADLIWAISCVVELWLLMIVSHYIDQLFEEEELAQGIDIEAGPPYPLRGSTGRGVGWRRTPRAMGGQRYGQVTMQQELNLEEDEKRGIDPRDDYRSYTSER